MIGKNSLVGLLLAVLAGGCQAAESESVEVPVEVEAEPDDDSNTIPIFATEIRTHHSTAAGNDYTVYVSLPVSYEMTTHSYPVVYVTDGDYMTLPTATIAGGLSIEQAMPEVITVGIGYGGAFEDAQRRRVDDLGIAGQESFLQFLLEELIPDIETNYRADPAVRTLMGHSYGGGFALYTLFNAPNAFANIIASSPYCDSRGCAVLEKAYAAEHDALPARLFANVGEFEEDFLPDFENLSAGLQASDYDGLSSELVIMDGETHMSVWPRAYTTGMKWVFADWDGSYHFNP